MDGQQNVGSSMSCFNVLNVFMASNIPYKRSHFAREDSDPTSVQLDLGPRIIPNLWDGEEVRDLDGWSYESQASGD
jgi:hypothetical protein